MKTIVGLYKSVDEANKVKSALGSEGFGADKITVIDQTPDSYTTGYENENPDHASVGGKIKHFFSSLSGADEPAHESYHQGVNNGGALLAVSVADERAEQVADLLYKHGATDIEGGYGETNTSYAGDSLANTRDNSYDKTAVATGEQVIPVVAEELVVGKRTVERGGVRIYSHLVSEEVSENVSLHDERVVMERRAVDRPATEADFADKGVYEVRAMGEEAVVGKASRVVEEIRVGKQASDHTEQVSDTVRHTEVDVEPTEVVTTGTTSTTKTGRL